MLWSVSSVFRESISLCRQATLVWDLIRSCFNRWLSCRQEEVKRRNMSVLWTASRETVLIQMFWNDRKMGIFSLTNVSSLIFFLKAGLSSFTVMFLYFSSIWWFTHLGWRFFDFRLYSHGCCWKCILCVCVCVCVCVCIHTHSHNHGNFWIVETLRSLVFSRTHISMNFYQQRFGNQRKDITMFTEETHFVCCKKENVTMDPTAFFALPLIGSFFGCTDINLIQA